MVAMWIEAIMDAIDHDLSPWLLRRLHLAAGIATQVNAAAGQTAEVPRSP